MKETAPAARQIYWHHVERRNRKERKQLMRSLPREMERGVSDTLAGIEPFALVKFYDSTKRRLYMVGVCSRELNCLSVGPISPDEHRLIAEAVTREPVWEESAIVPLVMHTLHSHRALAFDLPPSASAAPDAALTDAVRAALRRDFN
jgi:hypothetical protein